MSARGALRRSLVVWGWGQVAAGDRRGWLGPPAQVIAVAALVLAVPHAAGTSASLVYLGVATVVLAWAGIAVHAWHRARRRRLALGADAGGGAEDLLWLAPVALVLGAGFWVVSGSGADPVLTLDAYLADWRAGAADAAAGRWASLDPQSMREGWSRQEAALRNAALRVAAGEPAAEVDPPRPHDGLRWREIGGSESGGRVFAAEFVRTEAVRTELFGILPTTSQRLTAVETVGRAELRPVSLPGSGGPLGPVVAWRLVSLDMAGEALAPGG